MNDAIVSILIVEDDTSLQNVYAMILSSQGYRVSTACDGYEALTEIHKHTPDVILLDYFMPKMDGKTFMQNFDATEYPDTKIVLASNISDQNAIQEMRDLGIHDYVLKSDLSPSQLLDTVERARTL